jgi:hypothetical protein
MKLARVVVLLIAAPFLTLGSLLGGLAAQTGGIDGLVRGSHIIFVGQVVQLRAANLRVLPPTENTVLVRVSEVLDVPPSVASLKGELVTVQVARPGDVGQGDTEVFFTNGFLFGEHLAVKEVGHIPAPVSTTALRQEISAVRVQIEEEKLKSRVDGATLIIVGRAMEVKPLAKGVMRSEHEPDWAEVLVQVESVLKGSWREKTIAVVFPQSTDERWLLSPKFKPGQTGIWLLSHQGSTGLSESSWFALSPLDFQPLEQRELIHKLMR